MKQIIRKRYVIDVVLKKKFIFNYTNKISLSYEQANAYDTILFLVEMEDKWFDIIKWLSKFITNHSNCSKNDLKYLLYEYDKIFKQLQETYFKWVFKIADKQEAKEWVFESYIMILSDKFHTDPISILVDYTFEQLYYFTDGIIWNANEQTDEWKIKNQNTLTKKKFEDPDYKAKVDLLLKKLKEWTRK